MRFLRLLDLSLRSPKLPSKVIASFMKRIARAMMSQGQCHTPADKMFAISFIANMIKRHPRCVRLIHRKPRKYTEALTFTADPFLSEESDPSKTKALKSSLWEIQSLISSELDETVRNYCKLFKGDISRKTNFFKCEEFTSIDALDSIQNDLNSIDLKREAKAITKNLLIKNGQWIGR